MSNNHKRMHFYRGMPQTWHTSCGLHVSKIEMWTSNPKDVTCKNCKKSMVIQIAKGIKQMFDKELDEEPAYKYIWHDIKYSKNR